MNFGNTFTPPLMCVCKNPQNINMNINVYIYIYIDLSVHICLYFYTYFSSLSLCLYSPFETDDLPSYSKDDDTVHFISHEWLGFSHPDPD